MYDFYFGTKGEVDGDPKKFLLTIKRMLPRWCNSIPDSEYLALYDVINGLPLPDKPVFVETGSGASTIILCYFALKTGGEVFSWDINGCKLAYLRSVLNDTLMRHYDEKNLNNHWKYITFNSNSEFVGINVLKELDKKVSVCFLDSEHTLNTLMKELASVCDVLTDSAIVAIDDGNYSYISHNTAYINMVRRKIGLLPIQDSSDNIGRNFWKEVNDYLIANFKEVEYIKDSYKDNYQTDIFWSYFKSDREEMANLCMEKTEDLEHRFDAWKINIRK
jgi:hypothetical protein|tara:strand:- start:823 stop:1650 length:828 start_codon:yes stop_codon:yes gene_type:complete